MVDIGTWVLLKGFEHMKDMSSYLISVKEPFPFKGRLDKREVSKRDPLHLEDIPLVRRNYERMSLEEGWIVLVKASCME